MAVNLQPALKDTSVSLLLADSAGTLIHAMDAGSDLGPIGRRLVRIGESWSERTFGNNGLGTAAVLREPVAFEGSEHFSSALHPFATVGHPLFAHDGTSSRCSASLRISAPRRRRFSALSGSRVI